MEGCMTNPCAWCKRPDLFLQNGICDVCYWWYAWPRSFAAACTIALQIGDDEFAKQRLYRELKEIGEI